MLKTVLLTKYIHDNPCMLIFFADCKCGSWCSDFDDLQCAHGQCVRKWCKETSDCDPIRNERYVFERCSNGICEYAPPGK